jgi:hypothetical protein
MKAITNKKTKDQLGELFQTVRELRRKGRGGAWPG